MKQTLCFDFKTQQEIKFKEFTATGQVNLLLYKLLLFQDTRQILVAVILHNK